MPLHKYICECGHEYEELFFLFSKVEIEEKDLECPICKSKMKNRQIGNGGAIFKGIGWTCRNSSNRNYDTTSGIKEQTDEIKKQKDNWTSKDLYGRE